MKSPQPTAFELGPKENPACFWVPYFDRLKVCGLCLPVRPEDGLSSPSLRTRIPRRPKATKDPCWGGMGRNTTKLMIWVPEFCACPSTRKERYCQRTVTVGNHETAERAASMFMPWTRGPFWAGDTPIHLARSLSGGWQTAGLC